LDPQGGGGGHPDPPPKEQHVPHGPPPVVPPVPVVVGSSFFLNHHWCNSPNPMSTTTTATGTSTTRRTTPSLRAELFLQRIRDNHQSLVEYNPDHCDKNFHNFTVQLGSPDLVERVFELQDEYYHSQRQDDNVGGHHHHHHHVTMDIGYHYTKRTNLPYIQMYGLLTKAERRALNVPRMMMMTMEQLSNGGTFGDGIYTGNNPFSYHAFAGSDVCLMTARLKGTTVNFEEQHNASTNDNGGRANTILGRAGGSDEVCVLKSSAQCIPLVWFYSSLVSLESNDHLGNTMVHE
jgi:hypothetical protein